MLIKLVLLRVGVKLLSSMNKQMGSSAADRVRSLLKLPDEVLDFYRQSTNYAGEV